ncbi:uncharacterized protein LOC123292591 [Chrysoperla carnea]|uniref:uncharacterized protein LOC123292591 n=1 Tax=Chrysoperla carnea TaxID=189513 RepID=UPI001D06A13A|nr:uncharacterized protein LOC123292591 [Chrysoperla carnea]
MNRYGVHNLDWNFTKSRCIFCETKNRTSCGEHLQNGQKGRLTGGIDHTNSVLEKKYIEVTKDSDKKCGCLGNKNVTPRLNLCDTCGGYAYSGEIGCAETPRHNITALTADAAVPSDTAKFTCCPCRVKASEVKQLKLKAAAERLRKNNPLIGGPYADKLASVFSANNKGKQPIIVGYHSDGAPIYVSYTGTSNIIGYNDDGSPIQAGQGGVADKNLVMGYRKDGSPIHPPSNSNPKESMAVIGTYVKDGSPIIGSIKLWGGMLMKGIGRDGNPAYVPLSGPVAPIPKTITSTHSSLKDYTQKRSKENEKIQGLKGVVRTIPPTRSKISEQSKATDSVEQKKKADLDRLFKYYSRNRSKDPKAYKALMKILENFYPHCTNHQTCLREHDLVPKNRGWRWQNRFDNCLVSKLPHLFNPYYKPGAVPKIIAKEIEKGRSSRRYRKKYCVSYI